MIKEKTRDVANSAINRFSPEYVFAVGAAVVLLAGVGSKLSEGLSNREARLPSSDTSCVTSHPAEVGEGLNDLVLDVFPHANDLPEGVIKVTELGKVDGILGVNEQARICLPDAKSFDIALGNNRS